jgi:hypothetical protein
VVAGDGDRAAFGFLGSTEGGNYQDLATFNGIWNFYVATTYDRGAHWVTVNATADDPVQKGAICLAGILCSSSNRNLLDFNDIAVDREGRPLGAYADGCVAPPIGTCSAANNFTGRSNKAAIVRQLTGRRLFAAFDTVRVVSRKTHGAAGTFDIDLPLTGSPGIECRTGGPNGNYTVVFTFPYAIADCGSANIGTVTNGPNADQCTVNLTGITNAQYVTVGLSGVTVSGGPVITASVSFGVLVGDTTGNRAVNSSDISQTQSQSGKAVTNDNYREDVTCNGLINSSDIIAVQSASGTALPPP